MHTFSKVAAALIAASILAACSGGGTVTPPAGSSSTPLTSNTTGSRFISSSTTASSSQDFMYQANPPTKAFTTSAAPNAVVFPAPSVCVADFGLACYTPALIKTAYNVPSQYTGAGQTIVIIDAFGSPTLQTDFATFNSAMGLPNGTLNILTPFGQPTPFNPSNSNRVGWASETSLDVEWAHAIAPAATIDLIVALTNSGTDIGNAEAYAIQHFPGSVVSMSFGAGEQAIPSGSKNTHLQHDDALFQQSQDANITMIASSGDLGATNNSGALQAQFPASDPSVLSVGGTDLFMSDAGAYQSEYVWDDTIPAQCPFGCLDGIFGATGGAPSIIFRTPSYQQLLFHPATREVADVSYNAGVYTAVLVFESFRGPSNTGFFFTGGTSAGAPQWAGIVALANQAAGHPLGFINQDLYVIAKTGPYDSSFHDVTVGNNGLFGPPSESAGQGYDMPTGLGTPNVANLIPALITQASSH